MAVLLLGLLVIAGLVLLRHFLEARRFKNFPPGPPRLPIVGSLPFVPREYIHLHAERHWRHKYGPLVGMHIRDQPAVMLCGAEEVLAFLNHEQCQGRPGARMFTERSFGKRLGIMFSDGAYWTEQWRFMMRELGLGKSKQTDVMLNEMEATLDDMQRNGPPVEPNELFTAPTINVLWYMLAGQPFVRTKGIDPRSERLVRIMKIVARAKTLGTAPCDIWPTLKYIAPEWSGYNGLYRHIHEMQSFLRDEIKQQRQDEGSNSFMSEYCKKVDEAQAGSSYSEESLITMCLDLYLGGIATTSSTISFALLYMALHPDKQAKVQAELAAAGHSPGEMVASVDRKSTPYLEATLAEVMRINPAAPLTLPHRTTADVEMGGYTIPKDTVCLPSVWSVHHDKKHWGDPETFRPERFIDASGKFVKDPWVVPFGLGKRACPAEALAMTEATLFFTNLMSRFTFSFPAGSERPSTLAVPGVAVGPQDYTVLAVPRK